MAGTSVTPYASARSRSMARLRTSTEISSDVATTSRTSDSLRAHDSAAASDWEKTTSLTGSRRARNRSRTWLTFSADRSAMPRLYVRVVERVGAQSKSSGRNRIRGITGHADLSGGDVDEDGADVLEDDDRPPIVATRRELSNPHPRHGRTESSTKTFTPMRRFQSTRCRRTAITRRHNGPQPGPAVADGWPPRTRVPEDRARGHAPHPSASRSHNTRRT